VLLLHGGGQTRHSWGATAEVLAAHGWPTTTVDLRGHGDSDWATDGDYGLDAFAADVAALARACPAPPVLVGASLGGLASLLALEDPATPAVGLVLVDVAHRFEPSGGRRIIEFMSARPEGFDAPEQAADAVAAYLPHRDRPDDDSGLRHNLRLHDGRWRWHWDPALLDGANPLLDDDARRRLRARLEAVLRRLHIPVLLVRGALSDVVSPAIAAELCQLAPTADVVEVAGAGHMVAGDSNAPFTDAVLRFLARVA
jgi:pimeloyl-ACP methyl ester carboxylesterase